MLNFAGGAKISEATKFIYARLFVQVSCKEKVVEYTSGFSLARCPTSSTSIIPDVADGLLCLLWVRAFRTS